jgi:hypothetical protein
MEGMCWRAPESALSGARVQRRNYTAEHAESKAAVVGVGLSIDIANLAYFPFYRAVTVLRQRSIVRWVT